MQTQDLFITVGITLRGDARVLYAGNDSSKAQKASDGAGKEYAEVGVVPHPQVTFPRRPAEETVIAEQRTTRAQARVAEELRARKALLESKQAEAKRLVAEAKALEKELKATAAAAPESPKPTPESE